MIGHSTTYQQVMDIDPMDQQDKTEPLSSLSVNFVRPHEMIGDFRSLSKIGNQPFGKGAPVLILCGQIRPLK